MNHWRIYLPMIGASFFGVVLPLKAQLTESAEVRKLQETRLCHGKRWKC